jgi:hypothetical protein
VSLAKLAYPRAGRLLLARPFKGRLGRELEFNQHGPVAGWLDGPAVLDLGQRPLRDEVAAEPGLDCIRNFRATQPLAFTGARYSTGVRTMTPRGSAIP